ncbi:thioredoxin family protein [Haliovirga abyssi]|uniref:Thioredoxin-like fold domain-containing protein n=1 Tax=Haliovirga abyssi TaxID=2996794 RepID=A0AAU9D1T3_9FUSO|nr:thioredoxin family protein [Haliovirga abyssi]BDU49939.1 hypothetical protein HLVA_05080 [Haliovirga abyssi]
MDITILGVESRELLDLEINLLKVINKIEKDINIKKISDPKKIAERGIMSVPALIINGELKFSGEIPTVHELKIILKNLK